MKLWNILQNNNPLWQRLSRKPVEIWLLKQQQSGYCLAYLFLFHCRKSKLLCCSFHKVSHLFRPHHVFAIRQLLCNSAVFQVIYLWKNKRTVQILIDLLDNQWLSYMWILQFDCNLLTNICALAHYQTEAKVLTGYMFEKCWSEWSKMFIFW